MNEIFLFNCQSYLSGIYIFMLQRRCETVHPFPPLLPQYSQAQQKTLTAALCVLGTETWHRRVLGWTNPALFDSMYVLVPARGEPYEDTHCSMWSFVWWGPQWVTNKSDNGVGRQPMDEAFWGTENTYICWNFLKKLCDTIFRSLKGPWW